MAKADDGRTVDLNDIDTELSTLCRHIEGDSEAFRRIVEDLPVPLAVLQTSDGKILFTNRCLDETFGVARGSLLGGDWSYLFPIITDRRRLRDIAEKSGVVRGIELQSRREDGSSLWLSVWQQRIVCHGRECRLTILVDITRRKLDELRQRRKRKTLRRLLDSADRDRELIACDVHDGLLQEMTAALMRLEAARRAISKGKANPAEQVDIAASLVRDAIKEARSLIDGVRPPELDRIGLVAALNAFAEKTAENSGIRIEFVHKIPSGRLGPHLEAVVYRIVQESLNNVSRHSEAEEARVEVVADTEHVTITVRDWGVGFDSAQIDEKRFGLTSIRERARLFGGSVTIRSASTKGTTITAKLPLTESLRQQKPRHASPTRGSGRPPT